MENKFIGEVTQNSIDLLNKEFDKIPEKYRKPFNSTHEGYAVMLEEVRELEQEVFFGYKLHKRKAADMYRMRSIKPAEKNVDEVANLMHRDAIRSEAIQVAAHTYFKRAS